MRIRSAVVSPVLLCLLTLGGAGCPPTKPRVVNVRDVSRAGSEPQIDKVIDLGFARNTAPTLDLGLGDGHGVIGELLLLRGDDFGKQPTVTIGGQPATVVAHTSSGDIVVRVPWGIDSGPAVPIRVENAHGSHQASFPIERLVVVGRGDQLHFASVDSDATCKVGKTLAHRNAERLAISSSGATAIVGGGRPPHLTMVDLTASPPAPRGSHRLPGERVVALVVASQAPLAAAITDSHVIYIDQRRPGDLALYSALELPEEVREAGVVAAALSPRGKHLALALGKGNRVALFDASKPTALPNPRTVDVLPGVPLELLVGVRFPANGRSLWALSGNNPRSIAGGAQATRLSLVTKLDGEPEVADPIEISGVQAPQGAAMARGEPTPPGTAIRTADARSALFFGTYPIQLLKKGKDLTLTGELAGQTGRVEPAKGGAVLGRGPWLVGSLDVAGKTQIVVALAAGQSAGRPAWLLVSHRAWQEITPKVQHLADRPEVLASPADLGQLRLQP